MKVIGTYLEKKEKLTVTIQISSSLQSRIFCESKETYQQQDNDLLKVGQGTFLEIVEGSSDFSYDQI